VADGAAHEGFCCTPPRPSRGTEARVAVPRHSWAAEQGRRGAPRLLANARQAPCPPLGHLGRSHAPSARARGSRHKLRGCAEHRRRLDSRTACGESIIAVRTRPAAPPPWAWRKGHARLTSRSQCPVAAGKSSDAAAPKCDRGRSDPPEHPGRGRRRRGVERCPQRRTGSSLSSGDPVVVGERQAVMKHAVHAGQVRHHPRRLWLPALAAVRSSSGGHDADPTRTSGHLAERAELPRSTRHDLSAQLERCVAQDRGGGEVVAHEVAAGHRVEASSGHAGAELLGHVAAVESKVDARERAGAEREVRGELHNEAEAERSRAELQNQAAGDAKIQRLRAPGWRWV